MVPKIDEPIVRIPRLPNNPKWSSYSYPFCLGRISVLKQKFKVGLVSFYFLSLSQKLFICLW